jgi:hypothetical protein
MKPSPARLVPFAALGLACFGLGLWAGQGAARKGGAGEPSGQAALSPPRELARPMPRPSAGIDEGSGGGTGGGGAFAGFRGGDEARSLGRILADPDHRRRERELETLGQHDHAAGRDWRAAAVGIADLIDRAAYLRGVLTIWVGEDAPAAAAYLSALPLGAKSELIPHAVAAWVGHDAEAAGAWVAALPAGEVRNRALDSLFRAWASLDPEEASRRALSFSEEAGRHRALAAVTREWAVLDPAAAGAWTSRLGDPELKDLASMALVDELSGRLPAEAMRWAAEHLRSDPEANPDIVQLVASKAGFENPGDTFRWLRTLPPSPEAAASLAGVAAYLAEEDPGFAREGFAALPAEIRDLAAPSVASVLAVQNPDAGKTWLATLREGEGKRWAALSFASAWAESDPKAAAAWVAALPPGPTRDAASQGLEARSPEPGHAGARR